MQRTPRLLPTDDARGDEHGRVEDDAGQGERRPYGQHAGAVDEQDEGFPRGPVDALDLVIAQTERPQRLVVVEDVITELLDARLVLVAQVAGDEAPIELDDRAERHLLSGRTVEPTAGLDDHERLVVGRADGDRLEALEDEIERLADRVPLLRAALLEQLDELGRQRDGLAKLDDGARAEAMRMEVRQADRDDVQLERRVLGQRAEGHDRHARLERQQVGPVVRAALGKDADAAALAQLGVDLAVHLLRSVADRGERNAPSSDRCTAGSCT